MCKINANNSNPFEVELDKVKSLITWIKDQEEYIVDYGYQEYLIEQLEAIRPVYLTGLLSIIKEGSK